MNDYDQSSATVDRLLRAVPRNVGENPLSTLARALVDGQGKAVVEVRNGALVSSKTGAVIVGADGVIAGANTVTACDLYADSAHGNDRYSGQSPAAPLRTLAAVRVAALAHGAGVKIGLARGSYWRESLDLSAVANVVLQAVGTGVTPVIDGADMFTAWTKTTARTAVYQTSVAHNAPSDTERLTIYENGALLTRVADQATCDSTAGSFVDVKGSDGSPVTVYIHATGDGNPASNGKTYEVTTRLIALSGGPGFTCSGVQVMRAIDNNGALDLSTRTGVAVSSVLTLNGTKHNCVFGSGTLRDSIAMFADLPTSYEPGNVAWTAYIPDPTGQTLLFERVGTLSVPSPDFLAHGNGGMGYASAILRQCWTVGCPFTNIPDTGGGTRLAEGFYARGLSQAPSAGTYRQGMFYLPLAGADSANLYSPVWQDCVCFVETRYAAGNYLPVFADTSPYTFQGVAFAGLDLYDSVVNIRGAEASSGAVAVANSVFFGGGQSLCVPTGLTYTGDYNVIFCTKPQGEQVYLRWHGNDYTTLASWQTATGQDAHSVYLLATDQTAGNANAFWLAVKNAASGTDLSTVGPKVGDWRINPTARVYGGTGTAYTGTFPDGTAITLAGPQTHWDWNARASASGAPTVWPSVPATLADAQAYIAQPQSWVF